MKRREFITLLGGSAVTYPFVAQAQQTERTRRIGLLTNLAEADPEGQARIMAFLQSLQQLGLTDGRNVKIDIRWGAGNPERLRKFAAELIALAPDVILVTGSATVAPLLQATRTVPIVFVNVADPVGAGIVDSLAKPGGNATGFTLYEYSTSGKWLELLKEIAPGVTRAGVIRDPAEPSATGQFAAIQSVAPSFGVEVVAINARDAPDIERGITAFSRTSTGGLIVVVGASTTSNREVIIAQAAHNRLPAVYPYRYFVAAGGLLSYGPDLVDQFRRGAEYVVRILKGEKPGELPVQAPVKYETAINLKAAKALGITVPPTLLARADEVIE
jgi:putative tryptophan/tyrosine transport system substrate-binding protein